MMKDNGTWNMEISFSYMMTLPRWSSYSFNYSDWKDESDKTNGYEIKKFSIIDFLGYIYFLPSCITGPFSEYNDYIDFILQKNNYEKIKYDYIHVFKKLFLNVGIIVFYTLFKKYLHLDNVLEKYDEYIINNDNRTILDYFVVLMFYYLIYYARIKYYVGFLFADASCDLSGISFDHSKIALTSNEIYSKVQSVRVYECETTHMLKEYFKNWNLSIHLWLKRYVFKRIIGTVGKFKAEVITFIISGLWHGFYIPYHMLFGSIILGSILQSNLYPIRMGFKLWNMNKTIKNVLHLLFESIYFLTYMFTFNYFLLCMDHLSLQSLIEITLKLKFLPFYTLIFVTLFVLSVRKAFDCILKEHSIDEKNKEKKHK